jgi:DNA repair protein RadD
VSQTLRPYQADALEAIRAELRAGRRRVLLVSPTGSGKTTIAAEMVRSAVSRGNRVLFLAHRKELIDQCSARLDGCGVPHGVIMAGHSRFQPLEPVQVASIPTLVRRELPPASLVVVDEAHHARATTYEKILAGYPAAPVVGLSATPWRIDGKGLGELFEAVVVAARVRDLIAQGHLVSYSGFAYDHPSLASVDRKGADYDSHGLELVMGGRKLVGNIVGQWQRHAGGARTVVFACTVAHSREIVERFRLAGVAAEHLDGETPKEERTAILERLSTGRTRVVSNVAVLTEGWDCPAVEVCVLARPTLSVGLFLQMVGRVLRPAPGKQQARIHDHAGSILRHGLPDQDRDYALDADVRSPPGKEKAPGVRRCKACLAVYASDLPACPLCGAVPVGAWRRISEVDDAQVRAVALESIRQVEAPVEVRQAYFAKCMGIAQERNYEPGWASYRYKARFGTWPPREWGVAA